MSTSWPLELLHMDLFGPTTYASAGGNLYCLVIIDDFSRYTWVFFLHDKSEVASIFKKFSKTAQNEFDCKIKKISSVNGKEFDNTNIHGYCDEIGIKHEVSATYTPQQNGVVGRKNRTLITLARITHQRGFGLKMSTLLAMHQTEDYFLTGYLRRLHMNC
jgi:transposase InsO family protein